MKKILNILIFSLVALSISAQAPIASKWRTQSGGFYQSYIPVGTEKPFNLTFADTLKSGDTLFYVFPFSNGGAPRDFSVNSIFQKFKLITADSAVTITFWKSQDGVKWDTLKAGATSPTAYSKSIAKTGTTTYINYNGLVDNSLYYDGNYFAIRYRAAVKTSFKTIPYGVVSNIKKH
jgi:hypothetical protein